MYCANELVITMNNETAATAAMIAAKNTLTTTSIEEFVKGEFVKFANSLLVEKNEVRCTGDAAIWGDTYELILPEILKAVASLGNEFHGSGEWDSDYDTEDWKFSFDGKELEITSSRHNVDDEPMCVECDAEEYYLYDVDADCYICPECGCSITNEEFDAACNVTTIQKFTF